MKSSSELRFIARERLRGNWGTAIVSCLIVYLILNGTSILYSLIQLPTSLESLTEAMRYGYDEAPSSYYGSITSFISYMLMLFSALVNFIFGGVFTHGLASFFLNIIRKKASIANIFDGFKKFSECFLSALLIGIFTLLWFFLFFIPLAIILIIFSIALSNSPSISNFGNNAYGGIILFVILMLLLDIIIIICFALVLFRYAFVYYLIKDCKKTNPLNYIRQSKIMMRGKYFKFLLLNLSFIGWYILCFLLCGIGFLFLTPYVNATVAAFYEEALELSKLENKIIYVTLDNENTNFQLNNFYEI